MSKRWARIVLVVSLPVTVLVLSTTGASARPGAVKGSVSCSVVRGQVRFSPPLTSSGTMNNEVIRFQLTAAGCTTGDGATLQAVSSKSFRITMRITQAAGNSANSCATAMPANGSLRATSIGRWRTPGVALGRSLLTTTGESWSTAGSNVSVSIPGNGTATNNGTSFAGVENGGNSTIDLTFALTGAQYSAVCDPTTGRGHIARSSVRGGTIALGPSVFSGFTGSAAWVAGSDPLAPSDSDGQVLDLSSPQTCSAANSYTDCSFGGVTITAFDGISLSAVSALNYDFAVQTPGWAAPGGGSPRLVLFLSDGGNVQLNSEGAVLTTGTWVHLDAITGVVDNTNGTGESCGLYGISWSTAVTCHGAATITSAVIVNDSGWEAPSGFDVWVDNVTLNNIVVSAPLT